MKKSVILCLFSVLGFMSCGNYGRPAVPSVIYTNPMTVSMSNHATLSSGSRELSDLSPNCCIEYLGYTVSYNEYTLMPNWVSYELTAKETDGPYSRKGKNFRQDVSLNLRQADSDDYRNSGWSRGHMAPAGDFKWSSTAMEETFFFTNCCPQNQVLNAGQWNTLEQKVRDWANRYGSLTVYTGPIVLDNAYGTIGYNKVVVPDAFFKAILAGEQSIAFVMYNHNNNENMQKCAMSVDDLEALTGIDFFAEQVDDFENQVEATYNLRNWGL